eukprot:m.6665 g.6665  ORF g.6665 m.6665 type:complete len:247 (-) comp3565_c0_seq2:120-860(-)
MSTPVCLVTGSSRGIGFELVKQLLGKGTRVIATCRNPSSAQSLQELTKPYVEGKQALVLPMDVSNRESIRNCVKEVVSCGFCENGLQLLINNAGVLSDENDSLSATEQNLTEVFLVNVNGPMMVTQECSELLFTYAKQQNKTAKVLMVSSRLGSIECNTGGRVSYRVSKAAVNQLTKTLAMDIKDKGVAVAAVHPGWVQTDMGSSGGRKPPVTTHDSVKGLLSVVDNMTIDNSGSFYNFDGSLLPW